MKPRSRGRIDGDELVAALRDGTLLELQNSSASPQVRAALHLQVAQTLLLQLVARDGDDDAAAAYDLAAKAVRLLDVDKDATEH
jgi:hypothetical protein